MEVKLSAQQAKLFAVCIAHDVKAYINDHQEEFISFLKDQNYDCSKISEVSYKSNRSTLENFEKGGK